MHPEQPPKQFDRTFAHLHIYFMILNLLDRMKLPFRKNKEFLSALYDILGFYPHNIEIYRIAFSHKSLAYQRYNESKANGKDRKGNPKDRRDRKLRSENTSKPLNNERLEYLGDAVLETVVSDILFRHFPNKREGFLTSTRSKIVQREALNRLAADMGLEKLILAAQGTRMSHTNIGGNAFEALMGAIYLDRGYKFCHWFITNRVIGRYVDLDTVAQKEVNFKSKLLEWSQKNRININFKDSSTDGAEKGFRTVIIMEGLTISRGSGRSKKESQQEASKEALTRMRKEPKTYDSIFRAKEKRTAMEAEESFALPKIDEIEYDLTSGKANKNNTAAPILEERKSAKSLSDEAYDTAYDETASYEVIDTPPETEEVTTEYCEEKGLPAPPQQDELKEADDKLRKKRTRNRGPKTVGDAVKGVSKGATSAEEKAEKREAERQAEVERQRAKAERKRQEAEKAKAQAEAELQRKQAEAEQAEAERKQRLKAESIAKAEQARMEAERLAREEEERLAREEEALIAQAEAMMSAPTAPESAAAPTPTAEAEAPHKEHDTDTQNNIHLLMQALSAHAKAEVPHEMPQASTVEQEAIDEQITALTTQVDEQLHADVADQLANEAEIETEITEDAMQSASEAMQDAVEAMENEELTFIIKEDLTATDEFNQRLNDSTAQPAQATPKAKEAMPKAEEATPKAKQPPTEVTVNSTDEAIAPNEAFTAPNNEGVDPVQNDDDELQTLTARSLSFDDIMFGTEHDDLMVLMPNDGANTGTDTDPTEGAARSAKRNHRRRRNNHGNKKADKPAKNENKAADKPKKSATSTPPSPSNNDSSAKSKRNHRRYRGGKKGKDGSSQPTAPVSE